MRGASTPSMPPAGPPGGPRPRPPSPAIAQARAVARARAGALIQALRGLVVDVRPLRESHDFRLLFAGQVVSQVGSQMRTIALPYQVFLITHSSAMVGLLGLAQFLPLMLFSLVGGTLADAVDRRRILFFTQSGLAATSTLLAVSAFLGHPAVWYLFLLAALSAAIGAFDNPSRRAAIPRLVGRQHLAAAFALNQVLTKLSSAVGPALGGVIIAAFGLGAAYGADALSFLAVVVVLFGMAPMPPEPAAGSPPAADKSGLRLGMERIAEGVGYLRGRPVLLSAFLVDLNATFFGSPKALFPALATDVFHTGAAGLGLLYAAPSTGALAGALASGWIGGVRRQGRAVIAMVIVWGLAIAAFGLVPHRFWLGLGFLAVAGAADMVSAVLRSTILQAAIPDRLRGRLSAIHFMFTAGGPRLGDVEAGTVAQATSVGFSVVSGGVAAALGAIGILFAMPAFKRYDATRPEEV